MFCVLDERYPGLFIDRMVIMDREKKNKQENDTISHIQQINVSSELAAILTGFVNLQDCFRLRIVG